MFTDVFLGFKECKFEATYDSRCLEKQKPDTLIFLKKNLYFLYPYKYLAPKSYEFSLAKRLSFNPKTIAKWKKADRVNGNKSDPTIPKSTVLTEGYL